MCSHVCLGILIKLATVYVGSLCDVALLTAPIVVVYRLELVSINKYDKDRLIKLGAYIQKVRWLRMSFAMLS